MAIDALHNTQLLTDTITVTRNYIPVIPVTQPAPLEESMNYRGRRDILLRGMRGDIRGGFRGGRGGHLRGMER